MAGDADTAATNGESKLTYEQLMARDRASFLAGDRDEDATDETAEKPAKAKGKSAPVVEDADEDEIDDSDLEDDADDQDDELEASAEDDDEPEDDEDADLDEDDDKSAKVDPEVAKRLEQVKRTDKRLREQREQQFAAREREIAAREEQLKPKLEKLDRIEKLAERVRYEPEAVLLELGASEDDIEHAARRIYALTKAGKADPKVREAVERLTKEREASERIRKLEKEREEERTARQREAELGEQRRAIDTYLGKVAKVASDKTPLAKQFLAADPDAARAELENVAAAMSSKLGRLADPKSVMIEFEKQQRRTLRRYGIDPKTLAPAASSSASTTKTTPASGTKKNAAKKTDDDSSDKPLTKADFIRAASSGRYD